jgi:FlaA1/EpsC-like NDP-sugar epimerase
MDSGYEHSLYLVVPLMDSTSFDDGDAPALRALFPDRSWPEASLSSPSTLRDKTVLVSGAGGSLGRSVIQALCRRPVRRIYALDASEHVLVQLQSVLGDEAPPVECVLGDLRLSADRRRALARKPDIVIHAAAYKHVPFLEDRPIAAVENNLLATVDWARACRAAGVDQFVFVSTDKAVASTSVMGRTKLWGERWLRRRRDTTGAEPALTTVRLCNLFGSRGSVVPRFLDHLRAGEPLPVTHPDMHRWFMTPADASETILCGLAAGPGTYVPTSCLYVSIVTLARRLIEWGRPDARPEEWIRWVGRRPGERLHETLSGSNEEVRQVKGQSLRRVQEIPSVERLEARVEALRAACAEGEDDAVRELLRTEERIVPETGPVPSDAEAQ